MTMRITPEVISQNLLQAINATQNQLNKLQTEASTGQKFQVPSDNPQAVTSSMSYTTSLGLIKQYQQSSTAAQTLLQGSDTALSQAQTIWMQVLQTASEGANSTMTASNEQALAQQVSAAITGLSGVANTNLDGRYIFAGTNNQTAPWQNNTWSGNSNAIQFQVGYSTNVAVNVDGAVLFPSLFADLNSLQKALSQNPSAVATLLPTLQNDLTQLENARASVGANMQLVQQHQTRLTSLSQYLQENLASTMNVNMADVATLLAQEEQAYRAALTSGAQILPLSLLNFLGG